MAEFWAYTTKLYFNAGSGSLLVGAVRDIDGPAIGLDMVDIGSRDAGKLRKRAAGIATGGTLTFDIVYDPDLSTQAVLSSALTAGTVGTMFLVIDDLLETGWYGQAMVESFKPKAPTEDTLAADVTLTLMRAVDTINYLVDSVGDYMVDDLGSYWVV